MLVIESADDRTYDQIWAAIDKDVPDRFGEPSVGMANMQQDTFVETVLNRPGAFGLDAQANETYSQLHGDITPEQMLRTQAQGLWRDSANDEALSIRAAAYHLRDLMDMQPERSGTGRAYTQEQLAAIGYNVGPGFMTEIANGTYPSNHPTSDGRPRPPMGPDAQAYLIGFDDHWERTANAWICVEGVLAC